MFKGICSVRALIVGNCMSAPVKLHMHMCMFVSDKMNGYDERGWDVHGATPPTDVSPHRAPSGDARGYAPPSSHSHGAERDACMFYMRTGTCRHGDRCSRAHPRPYASRAIVLHNLYVAPGSSGAGGDSDFNEVYADVFLELARFGVVEELMVLGNLAHHLVGNVYARFRDEGSASSAVKGLAGRYYAGRIIRVELMPTGARNLGSSCCRSFEDEGHCRHGDGCNLFHVMRPSASLERALMTSAHRPGDATGNAHYS